METSQTPAARAKERLVDLFDRLGIPNEGRRLVQRAMAEAPVRKVNSSGRNVLTHFYSRKNGCFVDTESRHVEFPAAVGFEDDPKVIAYFPQPFTRAYEHIDEATGEVHTLRNTPDFLVLSEDGITVVECKPNATLLKESERRPFLFKQADDGTWFSPLLEAELGKLGLHYRIVTDFSYSRVWVGNCEHLADYRDELVEPCPEDVLAKVKALLQEEGHMTLHELVNAPHNLSADHLLKAVLDGVLVANLQDEPLYEPRCAWLYRDETYRDFVLSQKDVHQPGRPAFVVDIEPGARFRYGADTLSVALLSDKRVVLNRESGKTLEVERDWLLRGLENGQIESMAGVDGNGMRFQDYSEEQLATILLRKRLLEGGTTGAMPSERTMARHRAAQAAARANGGNEDLALAPLTHLRGNRTSRLDPPVLAMMEDVYVNIWRHSSAKNFKACYNQLVTKCALNALKAPSYPTFIRFIKDSASDSDVRVRQSSRYEYQQRAFFDSLEYETPIHGSRPLQFVHIDHTQVDLECVSARTGRRLARPWLSLAVCATTRRIVGMYLTYEPPSYKTTMMVIRDMVRRHGRMPEFIVVDNGSDFKSTAFASFLQLMRTHLRLRPKGSPRHGAVLERMFGRANTEFIHNLTGNTKATKQVRMVTGKSLPSNNAEWTLESLYHGLGYWADTFYANNEHPTLGESPLQAFERLSRECGTRSQRRVLFNRDFLIATCPPATRGGTRMVDRQTGVKVFNDHFWHSSFRHPKVAETMVRVRFDPFDASSAYAWVNGQWVQARSRRLALLPPMSTAALKALSDEYGRHFKTTQDSERDLQRLIEFASTFTPEGATAVFMDRLAESQALAERWSDGPITPFEPVARTLPTSTHAPSTTAPALPAPNLDGQQLDPDSDPPSEIPKPREQYLEDFDSF